VSIEGVAMLIVGAIATVVGLGVILFRDAVAQKNRENIEARLGRLLPGFSEHSTPGRMIPVGIGGILIGVGLIFRAITT
jgi:hypothetical protein